MDHFVPPKSSENLTWEGLLPAAGDQPALLLSIADKAVAAAELARPQVKVTLDFGHGLVQAYTRDNYDRRRDDDTQRFGRPVAAVVRIVETHRGTDIATAYLKLALRAGTLHVHASGTDPAKSRKLFKAAIHDASVRLDEFRSSTPWAQVIEATSAPTGTAGKRRRRRPAPAIRDAGAVVEFSRIGADESSTVSGQVQPSDGHVQAGDLVPDRNPVRRIGAWAEANKVWLGGIAGLLALGGTIVKVLVG
jgi:hypothetical protein